MNQMRVAGVVAAAAVALAGCGGAGSTATPDDAAHRALEAYVARVEPIRLGVNRLLDRADPILSAYSRHRLDARAAQRRIDALERRFARYTVRIAALRPVPAAIGAAHDAYAHTYVLEDAYLSALTAALPEREYADLPRTQDRQRAAIIAWRTRLEVAANRLRVRLPADIQVAGRGEIAPSPLGD